jgi:hypothetical protein
MNTGVSFQKEGKLGVLSVPCKIKTPNTPIYEVVTIGGRIKAKKLYQQGQQWQARVDVELLQNGVAILPCQHQRTAAATQQYDRNDDHDDQNCVVFLGGLNGGGIVFHKFLLKFF